MENLMKKLLATFIASFMFSLTAMAAVNINTATQAQLENLEGIGPVKAQAIIDYRKKNGGFKSVNDLEKVEGIGPATLQNVRKEVTITGKTTLPATASPVAKESKATKTKKESTSKKESISKKDADKKS
jgi:competence protein ComEA